MFFLLSATIVSMRPREPGDAPASAAEPSAHYNDRRLRLTNAEAERGAKPPTLSPDETYGSVKP